MSPKQRKAKQKRAKESKIPKEENKEALKRKWMNRDQEEWNPKFKNLEDQLKILLCHVIVKSIIS